MMTTSRKASGQPLMAASTRPAPTLRRKKQATRAKVMVARTLLIIGVLVLWQGLVSAGVIDAFWISSPILVGKELWSQVTSGTLLVDIGITVYEALIAFVISSILGIASGLLLARSPFWDMVLAPLIVMLNSMPRVAIAPLIILWFGIGLAAKVVTAFTLVYFILLVNTLSGAKNVDNDIRTIALLMGASRRDMLFKVTLPSALPWIFAGLNLGLTYSLLGVIVAEILSSNEGLGFVIAHNAGNFNTAGVFAGLIALSLVAWLFAIIMRKIETRLLRWKPSTTSA
jgi:NitT/TauT family transport system permease protein